MFLVAMSRNLLLLQLILTGQTLSSGVSRLEKGQTLSSAVSRLEKRLNVMERKLFQDTFAFREDIEMILERLENISNSTSEDSQTRKIEQEYNVSYSSRKTLADDTLKSVKKAMGEEKQYLRNILKEVTAEAERIRNAFAETETNLVEKQKVQGLTLETVKSKLANLETQMQHNNDGLKKKIEEISKNMLNEVQLDKQFDSLRERNHRDKEVYNSQMNEFERNLRILSLRQCSDPAWTTHGTSCYYIGKEKVTWENAYRMCVSYNAQLAEVDNSRENAFLIQLAKQKGVGGSGAWIGGTDQAKEGVWIWGTSNRRIYSIYSNFKGSEPNGGYRENCLILYKKKNWVWNDITCNSKASFICERKRLII